MINGKAFEVGGHGLILRYYPGIRHESLRKTTKPLNKNMRSQRRDLNAGPAEYEAGGLGHDVKSFGRLQHRREGSIGTDLKEMVFEVRN
jgi:hypothetical protein